MHACLTFRGNGSLLLGARPSAAKGAFAPGGLNTRYAGQSVGMRPGWLPARNRTFKRWRRTLPSIVQVLYSTRILYLIGSGNTVASRPRMGQVVGCDATEFLGDRGSLCLSGPELTISVWLKRGSA
jgi:hypothetical protein